MQYSEEKPQRMVYHYLCLACSSRYDMPGRCAKCHIMLRLSPLKDPDEDPLDS